LVIWRENLQFGHRDTASWATSGLFGNSFLEAVVTLIELHLPAVWQAIPRAEKRPGRTRDIWVLEVRRMRFLTSHRATMEYRPAPLQGA
jgi:hypothetical protein